MQRSAAQCSAVQCSAVQCSAVQCSAVQCSAECSTVQYSATVLDAGRERSGQTRPPALLHNWAWFMELSVFTSVQCVFTFGQISQQMNSSLSSQLSAISYQLSDADRDSLGFLSTFPSKSALHGDSHVSSVLINNSYNITLCTKCTSKYQQSIVPFKQSLWQ